MRRRYGWKQTYANGYTRNGFFWPLVVGAEVRSDDKPVEGDHICPRHSGDGLSIGLTARGICQGGIHSSTILIVSWNAADTAGEDDHKVRVLGTVRVEAVLDRDLILRQQGASADLTRAYLPGADLSYADLARANLAYAYLVGANLTCANLTGADLTGTNLGEWERGPDGYAVRKEQ